MQSILKHSLICGTWRPLMFRVGNILSEVYTVQVTTYTEGEEDVYYILSTKIDREYQEKSRLVTLFLFFFSTFL